MHPDPKAVPRGGGVAFSRDAATRPLFAMRPGSYTDVMTWTLPNILTVMRLCAAPGVALAFVVFARPFADWVALVLFVGASATDWVDGYLARLWNQTSRFGAMLDPIADKAMVTIALAVVLSLSRLDPVLVIPVAVILFREVFVAGLREFLGADAGRLRVTRLAKWKTTAQMVAIAVLMLAFAVQDHHIALFRSLETSRYEALLASGPQDWNSVWQSARGAWLAMGLGVLLIWVAAGLTAITGWDYFVKARPFLGEDKAE